MNTNKDFPYFVAVVTIGVLFLHLFCAGMVLAEPATGPSSSGDLYDEVEEYIDRQLQSLNIPGAALAIVEGDEIVHLHGFGTDRPGGEAPSPGTPFIIGSLTKSFTSLAVMQLVEAGKVEVDTPVQLYLPWFKVADPQASAQITVRHLLNQTSGLSQVPGMRALADFDSSPDAGERRARALSAFVPSRPAGSAFEYSNMNCNLLGLIIEAVSGESYADYIENHIFAPLGMSHSYTSKAEALQDDLAMGHTLWFGIPKAVPDLPLATGSLPSGQLMSSAEDMSRYLIAHLNGGRYAGIEILSPTGMAELHRPAVHTGSMGADMGDYAMGWFVEDTGSGKRIWHHGIAPDFFSFMTILPEQKRGMVLLVNGNHMMVPFVLLDVCLAAADLLAGHPIEATSPSVVLWVVRGFLFIPILQLIGVLVTLRKLRRWRRDAVHRPKPFKKWGVHILLASVPHLVLVTSIVVLIAARMLKFMLLFMPDITWLLLVCSGISLSWIFLRTCLILSQSRAPLQEQAFTKQPRAVPL
jgi:CubicO group peptidase (beta-lactamase class C family)